MSGIPVGPSSCIAAAEWTIKRLDGFRVPQPAGNRLFRAKRLLQDANDGKLTLVSQDEALLERVTEAQWTIIEQYIIARSLGRPGRALSDLQRRKLKEMLSGADTEDTEKNPLARNTQFELYTAATLIMGDVGVQLAEPDLRLQYFAEKVGIAAKRVQSLKQLVRRAKDGAQQLRRSRIRGFVALNVDLILKTDGRGQCTTEQLDERVVALREVDEVLSREPGVLGSLAFARDAVWRFDGPKPGLSMSHTHRFAVYASVEADRDRAERFWASARARIDERLQAL